MGQPKLLLPYGEQTVIGAVVTALKGGGVEDIIVVIDPDDRGLAQWAGNHGVGFTLNPDPGRGMLSSIQAGIESLGRGTALAARGGVLLVCPADLPALRPDTVSHLLARQAEGDAALVLPVHRGRRGHPLLIAARLVPEIGTLDPAIGLRQLLDRHAEDLVEVDVADPGVVQDMDTPQDYRHLLGAR
jgi:molybdenum cofactor cytidylyltransferase